MLIADVMSTVAMTTIAGAVCWLVFWGVIGALVARGRDWSLAAGAALAVALGPIGIGVILLVTRPARSSGGAILAEGHDRDLGSSWRGVVGDPMSSRIDDLDGPPPSSI